MADPIPFSFRCDARWDDMLGDGGRRLCPQCNHTVVDLSSLTRAKADAVLGTPGVCVNYEVVDGQVRYASESVGPQVQAARQHARRRSTGRRVARWAAAAASVLVSTSAQAGGVPEESSLERVRGWIHSWLEDEEGEPCVLPVAEVEPVDTGVVAPQPVPHVRLGGKPIRVRHPGPDAPPPPKELGKVVVHLNSEVPYTELEVMCEGSGFRGRASLASDSATVDGGVVGESCVAVFKGGSPVKVPVVMGETYRCSGEEQLSCSVE